MGWDIVDYDKDPPEIKGNHVRSEHTQAVHLGRLLDVFESMGLYAAMAFEFLTADAPHRPDDPRSTWHREPKEAFHVPAARYRRACQRQ